MKMLVKRSISLLLGMVLLLNLSAGIALKASAAEYSYNWGVRGAVATYLSDSAVDFYEANNVSYEELATLSGSTVVADVPTSRLYVELQDIMLENHTHITAYDETRSLFQYTDCQSGGGAISSFYSGVSVGPAWDGGATWNREHTWPNSKGLDGDDENDLMMLRPTASNENSARGNKAYGESDGFYDPNNASNGAYNLHGDVARIMLYTYVRWGNTEFMWGSDGVIESVEILLQWMAEDPVDTWELGRNDVVESITGTRNVFVDYPELAFLLFGEQPPVDLITPSGEAASNGYHIDATTNNSDWGAVSVSGRVINTCPAEGYEATGWELVSGTASVVQNGNAFIVSAESDCTIQINFSPKPIVGVFFWENGNLTNSYAVQAGDMIALPECNDVPEGYTFLGWSPLPVSAGTDYPNSYFYAGSSYTVESNVSLYAVYTYTAEDDSIASYVLVTDIDQLADGASVVIASADYDYAMSEVQNSNNRGQAAITKNADQTIAWSDDEKVAELLLGSGYVDNTYSFYCSENSGYLYCASNSSKNWLRTQSDMDEKASFAISVDSDGIATLTSQTTSSNRNKLQYNTSGLFACYNSTQKDVSLYVKTIGGTATFYTTGAEPDCSHDNVVYEAATSEWTEGLYCVDCQNYVFGHESVQDTDYMLGDANNDGTVDFRDAMLIHQYYLGTITAADLNTGNCDVNNDGSIDFRDAMLVHQYYLGGISKF